jgi:hypothetical protein
MNEGHNLINRPLNEVVYFGKSIVVSEKKRRAYFGGNDFPPSVDRTILPDKTIVSYWWKRPDELLQHQINYILKPEDLQGLESVDIATATTTNSMITNSASSALTSPPFIGVHSYNGSERRYLSVTVYQVHHQWITFLFPHPPFFF